jgi:hypothetical protein
MERLNAFIVSNKPALSRFYDQIVDHPERGKLTDITVRLLWLQSLRNHLTLQPLGTGTRSQRCTHQAAHIFGGQPGWRGGPPPRPWR